MDFIAHRTRSRAQVLGNTAVMTAANLAGGVALGAVEALLTSAFVALGAEPGVTDHQPDVSDFEAVLHDNPST